MKLRTPHSALRILFVLLFCAFFAFSWTLLGQTTVVYNATNFFGGANNRSFTIKLRSGGVYYGSGMVPNIPHTFQPVNGTLTFNLLPLTYLVDIDGIDQEFVMPIYPTTNIVNMLDAINQGTTMDRPQPAIAAGTNIALSTNYVAGQPVISLNVPSDIGFNSISIGGGLAGIDSQGNATFSTINSDGGNLFSDGIGNLYLLGSGGPSGNLNVFGNITGGSLNINSASIDGTGNLNLSGSYNEFTGWQGGNLSVSNQTTLAGNVTFYAGIVPGNPMSIYSANASGAWGPATNGVIQQNTTLLNNTGQPIFLNVLGGVEVMSVGTGSVSVVFTAINSEGSYTWSTNISTSATGWTDFNKSFVLDNNTYLQWRVDKVGMQQYRVNWSAYRWQ